MASSLVDITTAENFNHFTAEVIHNFQPRMGRQFINIGFEKIVLQVNLLKHHLRMEQIGPIHIDVNRIVPSQRFRCNVVLDGCKDIPEIFAISSLGKVT